MTASPALVRSERMGRTAILTLDRPPVNALSIAMYASLSRSLADLEADSAVSAVVLTGAGRRAFTAGADIREFVELTPTTRRERHEFVTGVFEQLSAFPLPVICAINGPAPGGGLVLASLCDYRVASDTAFFSMPEIDRGTVAGGGVFLRRLGVPSGILRRMLYTGLRVEIAQALEIGLVDEVTTSDRLLDRALEIAQPIAAKARAALVLMKRAILTAESRVEWLDAYRATHEFSAEFTGLREAREGMTAFLEQRTPNYYDDDCRESRP